MKVKVANYNLFKWVEVWRITEWKDGAIYRTKSTGCFMYKTDAEQLDPQQYVTSSVSTTLMKQSVVELEVFTL